MWEKGVTIVESSEQNEASPFSSLLLYHFVYDLAERFAVRWVTIVRKVFVYGPSRGIQPTLISHLQLRECSVPREHRWALIWLPFWHIKVTELRNTHAVKSRSTAQGNSTGTLNVQQPYVSLRMVFGKDHALFCPAYLKVIWNIHWHWVQTVYRGCPNNFGEGTQYCITLNAVVCGTRLLASNQVSSPDRFLVTAWFFSLIWCAWLTLRATTNDDNQMTPATIRCELQPNTTSYVTCITKSFTTSDKGIGSSVLVFIATEQS